MAIMTLQALIGAQREEVESLKKRIEGIDTILAQSAQVKNDLVVEWLKENGVLEGLLKAEQALEKREQGERYAGQIKGPSETYGSRLSPRKSRGKNKNGHEPDAARGIRQAAEEGPARQGQAAKQEHAQA